MKARSNSSTVSLNLILIFQDLENRHQFAIQDFFLLVNTFDFRQGINERNESIKYQYSLEIFKNTYIHSNLGFPQFRKKIVYREIHCSSIHHNSDQFEMRSE